MADLASGDVVYVLQSQRKEDSGLKHFVFSVAFGDGAKTYPAGGVPLLKGSLGCPNEIKSLALFSPAAADGLVYKYDFANNKIRIYEADYPAVAEGALIELDAGSDAPAAATLYVEAVGW